MHDIDGNNIFDVNHDKVCLNCIHWRVNVQLKGFCGLTDGVIRTFLFDSFEGGTYYNNITAKKSNMIF